MNRTHLTRTLLPVVLLTACADPADEPFAGHVSVIERRVQATNAKDWDTWESLHTPDAVRTAPDPPAPLQGAGAMRAAIETLVRAFPDYPLEVLDVFGQDDRLAVRLHTTGTMTGVLDLGGGVEIPPTGRGIDQEWVALVRFEGDAIAEFQEYYDLQLLLTQLGLDL